VGCALLVIILFSGFNIMSRVGSGVGFAVSDMAALRFAIGGLIMLPFFMRNRLRGLSISQVLTIAFLGGLGFALFAYAGFFMAPAAHGAVLLHGTLPLFTFVVCVTLGDDVRRGAVPGVVLIAVGIGLMALDTMRGATVMQLLGDACLLLASLCWSTCGILIKRAGVSSVQGSTIIVVVSACLYLPVYFTVIGFGGLLAADPGDVVLQAIFQGAFIGALSIFVYTRSVQSLGPNGTALFTAAIPGVTTLVAIPALGELPSALEWAGVGIVTVGMVAAFAERLFRR
jgi:drug/metabolite transporter (DMT)-like permease